MKNKVAIIGLGYVGSAVKNAIETETNELYLIDPKLGTHINQLKNKTFDYIFVCLPTPMGQNGAIDVSILKSTFEYLKDNVYGTIILKSTVLPDELVNFSFLLGADRFVYMPEFLREKTGIEDFLTQSFCVIGFDGIRQKQTIQRIKTFFNEHTKCNIKQYATCSLIEASYVKYGINCFLASKVAWFNQFYSIVNSDGADYDAIIDIMKLDDRIGCSHLNVPGPDGKYGFGGACFPKDIKAFLNYGMDDDDLTILRSVIKYNDIVRSQYKLDERELEQNVNFS